MRDPSNRTRILVAEQGNRVRIPDSPGCCNSCKSPLTQATDKESVSEYREGVFGLGKVRRPAEVGEKQMNVRGGVRSIESLITISMDYACITITKRDGSKRTSRLRKSSGLSLRLIVPTV